jgi:2,5-diketo-D-gluconate reductase B
MQYVEANGARIPAIGLGTWELRGRTCARLVEQALRLGYRHIDTAQVYENESEVGEGLRASGITRDEVFVTTKVWTTHFAPNDLERSTRESLARLRLAEVDLLLLHWPNPRIPLQETLGALARVKKLGMAKHIGVSNFTVALIEEAVAASPEPLVCDQVEYHPYLNQTKVRQACVENGMALVAYSPVAKGRIKNDKALARIGENYGKTAAQVCLRCWCSRTLPRYRAPRRSSGCRKISRSSTSNCPTRRCARFPQWAARKRASPISDSPRSGIEKPRRRSILPRQAEAIGAAEIIGVGGLALAVDNKAASPRQRYRCAADRHQQPVPVAIRHHRMRNFRRAQRAGAGAHQDVKDGFFEGNGLRRIVGGHACCNGALIQTPQAVRHSRSRLISARLAGSRFRPANSRNPPAPA